MKQHIVWIGLAFLVLGFALLPDLLFVGCDKINVDAPEVSPCLNTTAEITVIHYSATDTTRTPLRELLMQLGQGCDTPGETRKRMAFAHQMEMTGWAIEIEGNSYVAVGFVE